MFHPLFLSVAGGIDNNNNGDIEMVKIDELIVTGSAKTSHSFTDLDGDVDKRYQIKCELISGAASNDVLVQPNGDSTSSNYYIRRQTNGGTDVLSLAGCLVAATANASEESSGHMEMGSKTGRQRWMQSLYGRNSSDTVIEISQTISMWKNSGDNITSIDVVSSATNGLGIGTIIELWAER